MVAVIIHKYADFILKFRGTVIMIEKNEIFHVTVVILYLPLRHRTIRLATGMADPFFFKIVPQGF